MLTAVFVILLIMVFGKIGMFALKATWSIAKFLLTVVFLPLILIGLVIKGLLMIAFPILLVIAVITLFKTIR